MMKRTPVSGPFNVSTWTVCSFSVNRELLPSPVGSRGGVEEIPGVVVTIWNG